MKLTIVTKLETKDTSLLSDGTKRVRRNCSIHLQYAQPIQNVSEVTFLYTPEFYDSVQTGDTLKLCLAFQPDDEA